MLSFGASTSSLPPPLIACKNTTLSSFGWNPTPLKFKPPQSIHLNQSKARPSNSNALLMIRSYKLASSPSNLFVNHDHQGGGEEEKTAEELELQAMCKGLKQELMPKHVALFMDGHRRWAKERGLPVDLGYGASRRPLKAIAKLCCLLGIKVLSVFVFSSQRPKDEVNLGLNLIESFIKSDLQEMARNDIRFSTIGNHLLIPNHLQEIIRQAEETTKGNKRLHIIGGLDYTGRSDIIQACTSLAEKVQESLIQPADIDESMIQRELQTKCSEYPNPDLFIRTGDVNRLDNFMLWQLAYSELHFVEKYAPDFKAVDFVQALSSYQKRHRRFGGHKYESNAPMVSQE